MKSIPKLRHSAVWDHKIINVQDKLPNKLRNTPEVSQGILYMPGNIRKQIKVTGLPVAVGRMII